MQKILFCASFVTVRAKTVTAADYETTIRAVIAGLLTPLEKFSFSAIKRLIFDVFENC